MAISFLSAQTPRLLALALALAAGLGGSQGIATALVRSDGTVVFEAPPRAIAASTSRSTASTRNATYYFTLNLPEEAGEPLGRVVITPRAGARWMWPYDLDATVAFVGDRSQRGADLPLGEIVSDPDTMAVTVNFDPPLAPGQVITLALAPQLTPRGGGTYDFEVTTYPAGDQAEGQYAGVVRLNFYERDSDNPYF